MKWDWELMTMVSRLKDNGSVHVSRNTLPSAIWSQSVNIKNAFLALTAVFICSGLLGARVTQGFAMEEFSSANFELAADEPAEVYLGRGGIYMVNSAYNATAVINRIKPNKLIHPHQNLEFVDRWIDFSIYDDFGIAYQTLWGLNYVYFNLTYDHREFWEEGLLSIYYWDPMQLKWIVCPSFLVSDENLPHGRIVCVMQKFGTYGLAMNK